MVVGVEDVRLALTRDRNDVAHPLEQLVHGGPLQDRLDGETGHEADQIQLVHLLELLPVAGEQALGHQLQQHRVVALEGGEDVRVRLERGQPVGHEVALRRRTPRAPPGASAWCARWLAP